MTSLSRDKESGMQMTSVEASGQSLRTTRGRARGRTSGTAHGGSSGNQRSYSRKNVREDGQDYRWHGHSGSDDGEVGRQIQMLQQLCCATKTQSIAYARRILG